MQKKKVKKFNVKQSVMLLLLLAVFLILSTYAWFTSNRLVKVETLQVNVETSAGFQISVDAVNWKSVIAPADIVDTTKARNFWEDHFNHIPTSNPTANADQKMKPVSTIGAKTANGLLDMYVGTVDANTSTGYLELTAAVSEDDISNKDYIAFDLFMKTTQDVKLLLDLDSGVIGGPNTAGVTKGLENSVRVAFVNQAHLSYEEFETTDIGTLVDGMGTYDGDIDNTGGEYDGISGLEAIRDLKLAKQVIFWEPNSDSHTSAAVNDAMNSYGKSILQTTKVATYDAVKAEILAANAVRLTDANKTNKPAYFGTVPTDATLTLIQTEKPILDVGDEAIPSLNIPAYDPLKDYEPGQADYYLNFGNGKLDDTVDLGIQLDAGVTKIRVYMWIEGQDYDCQDFASGTDLLFNLVFTIETP